MRNYKTKLIDSSRFIADVLVDDLCKHPDGISEILDICLLDEYPLSMRAARVVGLISNKNPDLIIPYLDRIIEGLKTVSTEGVRRGFLHIFAVSNPRLNEDQIGYITDMAFTWLADNKQALAVRYYSIEILLHVTKIYPEISVELSSILKTFDESAPASLQAASHKVLKTLNKKG